MNLNDQEKVLYLANLIAISRVDGIVSQNELSVIETVQKRIGARKTELKKAENLVQSGDFKSKSVGKFSERAANLEDMMMVALADGALDDSEKSILISFAKQIGITNEQVKLIFSERKSVLASVNATQACPSCSAKVQNDAKFCPECGGSLGKTDTAVAIVREYTIPTVGIVIEFAESTASGFIDAVRKAKASLEYAECQKGKKTWYMSTWSRDQISEAAKLAEDLKGMRNRKVWVDGKESPWDEVFGFTWCSKQRDTAYRPIGYCFGLDDKRLNLWGCKNANLDWVKWGDWFSFGRFQKSGILKDKYTFVFDKNRIRHELENNLFRFRFCPYLNFQLVEAVLAEFPNEVEIKPGGEWVYKQDYNESPGSIRVKEKVVENGYTYTNEFHSSGVVPRGSEVGIRILKRALQSAGLEESQIKGVLSYSE